MDESDGLENRYGGNLIVGSNPTPSATFRHEKGPQTKNLRAFFFVDVHQMCMDYFPICVSCYTIKLLEAPS